MPNILGWYTYDRFSICQNIYENVICVYYYVRYDPTDGKYFAVYVGSTERGQERLLEHLNAEEWPEVSHFGYVLFSTIAQAQEYEKSEIERLKPPRNKQVAWRY